MLLSPGGLWKDQMLIRGGIGTASKAAASTKLMRIFSTSVKKNFASIRGIFVGAEAENLWRKGFRLTGAEQSPAEYDLAP